MKSSTIQAEVTGTVWKMSAAVADTVQQTQELLILESMKMENPASANGACTVRENPVEEGEAVSQGQSLVVIELR